MDIQQTKELRVDIDALATEIKFNGRSTLTSRSAESLLMAKAWLGNYLAEVGNDNPYTVANTISNIPETQDVTDQINTPITDDDEYLQAINRLRTEIAAVREVLPTTISNNINRCSELLTEARFYLAFELQRLKELHTFNQSKGSKLK